MKRKKIAIVFGTRPEAIKMAPVIKELEKYPDLFETQVIVTAQHREMLDQVLKVFKIEPDFDLNIMKKNQSLSDITADTLKGLEKIYIQENPDMVLVHGDTTTSFSAALAAFYHQIPIGHVEAGLRTNDKYFPFPEEANRQMIDNLVDVFFAPTQATKENLLLENKPKEQIVVTGNTAIDAIHYTKTLTAKNPILNEMTADKKWILLTMHRRENQGKPMENVFQAVKKVLDENKNTAVVMPVHLSPTIQSHVKETLSEHDRILLIEPLEVDVFHQVIGKSTLVLTDSGGLQEEAPALNVPVLVLRNKTERPEGKEAGTLEVIGTEEQDVYQSVSRLLNDPLLHYKMASAINPYGDGRASLRIVNWMKDFFDNER